MDSYHPHSATTTTTTTNTTNNDYLQSNLSLSSTKISTVYIVLVSFDITMIFLSLLLNLLGVYLLVQLRRPKNIHLVLTHLSIVEITVQAIRFVSIIYFFRYDDHETQLGYQITRTLTVQGFCVTYVLVMVVVALDPLLIVTLKLMYQRRVTRQKTNFLLTICWSVGLICGTGSFAFTYKERESISLKYTFPITTSLFLLFSLTSYAIIYRHVKYGSRKNMNAKSLGSSTSSSTTMSIRTTLKFRVPLLITSTFFLFCLTPSVVQMALRYACWLTKNMLLVIGICFSLGFIIDSLIYIFLHPMVKKILIRLVDRRRHSSSRNLTSTMKMTRDSTPYFDRTKV